MPEPDEPTTSWRANAGPDVSGLVSDGVNTPSVMSPVAAQAASARSVSRSATAAIVMTSAAPIAPKVTAASSWPTRRISLQLREVAAARFVCEHVAEIRRVCQ